MCRQVDVPEASGAASDPGAPGLLCTGILRLHSADGPCMHPPWQRRRYGGKRVNLLERGAWSYSNFSNVPLLMTNHEYFVAIFSVSVSPYESYITAGMRSCDMCPLFWSTADEGGCLYPGARGGQVTGAHRRAGAGVSEGKHII